MASIKINRDSHGVIKSCRWRACLGRDERGKQIWATKTVSEIPDEKTEARIKKAWQLQADLWEQGLLNGTQSTDNSTFRGFLENVFWPLRVENGKIKPSTAAYYANIKVRALEYFGKKKLSAIRQTDIEKFLIWLSSQKQKNGRPLSASTQKHDFDFIKIVFGYAEDKNYIVRNPTRGVKPPKQPHKDVDYLPQADAQAFINALQNEPLRWRAIMQLLIYLGLRRGEVVGLQWQDIDFDANAIKVQRNVTYTAQFGVKVAEPKTANSFRTLPAPAVVMATLRAWKAEQTEYFRKIADTAHASIIITPTAFVFSGDLDPYTPQFPTNVTSRLKKFCKEHGLPDVSPHDLRHTCGSLMLEAGVNVKSVQTFLGHSDASTTLRFYAGVDQNALRKAGEQLAETLVCGG